MIDAHLVGWYYQTEELGLQTPCSASPTDLVKQLGTVDVGVLDVDGHIEHEWRAQADTDWFEAWLAERFHLGDIVEIEIETCQELLDELRTRCGFRLDTGDKWYVRTAATRANTGRNTVALLSEDLDFYDPKAKKKARNRGKILRDCSGPVARYLRKRNVDPRTVKRHLLS